MIKTKINSINAAQKLGAYSHGYKVDIGDSQMIFTTGQIDLDKDGNVVGIGDIEKKTEFVFESLQNILNEAGASLDDVVKATIYVTDINDCHAHVGNMGGRVWTPQELLAQMDEAGVDYSLLITLEEQQENKQLTIE